MSAVVIFEGQSYRVHSSIPTDGPVVICFAPWRPPAANLRPFGLDIMLQSKRNVIAIEAFKNDWYYTREFDAALAAIDAAAGDRFRIGYGSSMGAYAALNFSRRLNIGRVVLFSPQISLDPQKAPWETRWESERAGLVFRNDAIHEVPPAKGYLVVDPHEPNDRKHAEAIMSHHPDLELIPVPFAGHFALNWFAQNKTIREVVFAMLFADDAAPVVRRLRRRGRSDIPVYWAYLSRAYRKRGRHQHAKRAAALAAEHSARATALAAERSAPL
jgi:alpha-beta hydrolase superfamily lysophospholipase